MTNMTAFCSFSAVKSVQVGISPNAEKTENQAVDL